MDAFRFKDLRPDIPLIDDGSIVDDYADGVATVQVLGGNIRTVYFTWEFPPGSAVLRRVVRRIVRPLASFPVPGGGILEGLDLPCGIALN